MARARRYRMIVRHITVSSCESPASASSPRATVSDRATAWRSGTEAGRPAGVPRAAIGGGAGGADARAAEPPGRIDRSYWHDEQAHKTCRRPRGAVDARAARGVRRWNADRCTRAHATAPLARSFDLRARSLRAGHGSPPLRGLRHLHRGLLLRATAARGRRVRAGAPGAHRRVVVARALGAAR